MPSNTNLPAGHRTSPAFRVLSDRPSRSDMSDLSDRSDVSCPSPSLPPTAIELLAPARNLACAMAAIDHGADAVYMGAEEFGARASAGNSDEDIASVVAYARPFGVKVYVTLNTLLNGRDELLRARDLAWRMHSIGVDALIVQDERLATLPGFPPIPLHASTQMDNHTAGKVRRLHAQGYEQVVLARELSLEEIAAIHQSVPEAVLEVFVHGAICVSYNGRCYASQVCYGRSANRGECAQFCRMPYDLEDAAGRKLATGRYLLSMRDMNRTKELEALLDAGARSLKIEGRLKDEAYVRNVTAWYRSRLDDIFRRRREYCRASMGRVELSFTPDPSRSFNRGFTDYFMHGRTTDLCNSATPKSMGQPVGFVKAVRRDHIVVAGTASFANGDGLCYISDEGGQPCLVGFRINRAEGNHLYPHRMPQGLREGTTVYRNQDQRMEATLAGTTARRTLPLQWTLAETPAGFRLEVAQVSGPLPSDASTLPPDADTASPEARPLPQAVRTASREYEYAHQPARTDQSASIRDVLSRLGDTVYETVGVIVRFSSPWFIPRSLLASWRRELLQDIATVPALHDGAPSRPDDAPARRAIPATLCDIGPVDDTCPEPHPLMTCRYCIRYQTGQCLRNNPQAVQGNLYLRGADGRRFRLRFDCRTCHMIVDTDDRE